MVIDCILTPSAAPSTSSAITHTGLLLPTRCVPTAPLILSLTTWPERSSLALISRISYPACFAITCATVVLPIPGGPWISRMRRCGRSNGSLYISLLPALLSALAGVSALKTALLQPRSHLRSWRCVFSGPRRSSHFLGRHFSDKSTVGLSLCCGGSGCDCFGRARWASWYWFWASTWSSSRWMGTP